MLFRSALRCTVSAAKDGKPKARLQVPAGMSAADRQKLDACLAAVPVGITLETVASEVS